MCLKKQLRAGPRWAYGPFSRAQAGPGPRVGHFRRARDGYRPQFAGMGLKIRPRSTLM